MDKLFAADLDRERWDFNKEYYLKGNPYKLKDLPDDTLIKIKQDGTLDKRTFLPMCPGWGEGGGRPRKKAEKPLDLSDPKNLRKMFQSCFDTKEVSRLVDKAKEVAIKNGNQKMIQFLLEQLFGKAPQYVTHAGDDDHPLWHKEVKDMNEEEVDEFLSKVVEVKHEQKEKS